MIDLFFAMGNYLHYAQCLPLHGIKQSVTKISLCVSVWVAQHGVLSLVHVCDAVCLYLCLSVSLFVCLSLCLCVCEWLRMEYCRWYMCAMPSVCLCLCVCVIRLSASVCLCLCKGISKVKDGYLL